MYVCMYMCVCVRARLPNAWTFGRISFKLSAFKNLSATGHFLVNMNILAAKQKPFIWASQTHNDNFLDNGFNNLD
jgi:hypothetical protein